MQSARSAARALSRPNPEKERASGDRPPRRNASFGLSAAVAAAHGNLIAAAKAAEACDDK